MLPINIADSFPSRSIIEDYFSVSLTQPLYCPSSLCVEKSVFKTIGVFNEKITFGEDIDFNIRANQTYKLAYSKNAFVQYLTISENQITQSKLGSKTITDFNYYEKKYPENHSLKKYLDFQRYVHAKMYKLEGNISSNNKLVSEIILSNLNWKQKILLFTPSLLLRIIKNLKLQLLLKGCKISTYS
jgi:GT2 family glycosyltransferase